MLAKSDATSVMNDVLDKFEEVVDYFADITSEFITYQIESEGRFGNANWPELSNATLAIRVSDGIVGSLIGYRTGTMLRSLEVKKEGRFKVTIQFTCPKVQIDTFEKGATIRVTPKMVKWLAYHGVFISSQKERIYIPARPILEPLIPKIKAAVDRKLASLNIPIEATIRRTG
jgi:hypothetical protein